MEAQVIGDGGGYFSFICLYLGTRIWTCHEGFEGLDFFSTQQLAGRHLLALQQNVGLAMGVWGEATPSINVNHLGNFSVIL